MSLISDALKEAQRERSERSGTTSRSAASVADSFFPHPPRERRVPVPARTLAVGGAAAGTLVLAALFVFRARAMPATLVAQATPTPRTVPSDAKPPMVVPTPVPPSAEVSRPPAVPVAPLSIVSPAAMSRAAAGSASSEASPAPGESHIDAPPPGAAAPRTDAPRIVATAAPTPTAPTPTAPTPSAPTTTVRVVLGPVSSEPGDSLFAEAFSEQSRGNYDRAAELYERALQLRPVSPQLYNDYGALLASRGNHTAAIAMYALGLKSDDRDARLWINLGDSYRAVGRHADAMSTYAEAAKLDPSNAALKARLAAEYFAIGDTASARRGYDDAARTAPRDPAIHHAFGVFLQSQHDYPGAIREFQLFVNLAPGKFPSETIDGVRSHVARLTKLSS